MTIDTEIDFCNRREREERAAAVISAHENVRDAHFVMAERYADRSCSLAEEKYDLACVVIEASTPAPSGPEQQLERIAPRVLAHILERTPLWARINMASTDQRERSEAAETIAAIVSAKLSDPIASIVFARQIASEGSPKPTLTLV